jgi:hypothetical protein
VGAVSVRIHSNHQKKLTEQRKGGKTKPQSKQNTNGMATALLLQLAVTNMVITVIIIIVIIIMMMMIIIIIIIITISSRICFLFKAYTGERAWNCIWDRLQGPCYLSTDVHDSKIGARKQRTDIGKYCFVNRTIKLWNKLPAEALAAFPL